MKNFDLIYEHVNSSKCKISKKSRNEFVTQINITDKEISGKTLYTLTSKFKFLIENYRFIKLNISINFTNPLMFKDKICYLLLDLLIYDIFKKTNFNIHFSFKKFDEDSYINSKGFGFFNSTLWRTYKNSTSYYLDKNLFIKELKKPIFRSDFYRRFITADKLKDDLYIESTIFSDIGNALSIQNTSFDKDLDDFITSISENVAELLCNVKSHTDSDCIIDINFEKIDNKFLTYIAIINFSKNRLFDNIKENIECKRYNPNDVLYHDVYKALDFHKKYFNESYTPEHFFMLTAFQNHVTSRYMESGSNGTGLTVLIKNIIGKAEKDYSYVLSGNQILVFKNEFLNLSENNFIGFNNENNYISNIPDESIIDDSRLYIPGTIYNLFLIKEIDTNGQ